MDNKCPKCSTKLNVFYLKPNCPKCGTNLMYYHMEQRLEQDEINAAKEVERWNNVSKGIKASSVGSVLPILRLALYVLSIAVLLLPSFQSAGSLMGMAHGEGVGLLQLISAITAEGADIMGVLFGSQSGMLCTIFMLGVVLLALASLIASLFSYTKSGTVRNTVMTVLMACVQLIPAILLVTGGHGTFGTGFYAAMALTAMIFILNFIIGKQFKKN